MVQLVGQSAAQSYGTGEKVLFLAVVRRVRKEENCDMRRAILTGDKSGHPLQLAGALTLLQESGGFSRLEVLPVGLFPSPISDLGHMHMDQH